MAGAAAYVLGLAAVAGAVWMQVPAGTVGTAAAEDDPDCVPVAVVAPDELLELLLEPQAVRTIRPAVARTAATLRWVHVVIAGG